MLCLAQAGVEEAQGEKIKFPAIETARAKVLDAKCGVSPGEGPVVSRRHSRASSQAVSFLT